MRHSTLGLTDPKRGRSIMGYVLHFGEAPVAWRNYLQSTVADSPNAAEYIALYEAAVATVGVQNLIQNFGIEKYGTPLYCMKIMMV